MVQEGWKKHTTGDANGDKNSENKKTFLTRRKENGTRKTCVQKRKTREKKTQRE